MTKCGELNCDHQCEDGIIYCACHQHEMKDCINKAVEKAMGELLEELKQKESPYYRSEIVEILYARYPNARKEYPTCAKCGKALDCCYCDEPNAKLSLSKSDEKKVK